MDWNWQFVGQFVLIQLVSFAVIIIFLRWVLYRDITSTLSRLKQLNQENLKREEELKRELENARTECEEEIKRGQAEAGRIKDESRALAQATKEDAVQEARQEAKKIIVAAEEEKTRLNQKFISSVEAKIVELAFDLIKYVFTRELKEALHKELTDELIKQVQDLPPEKVIAEGTGRVKIVSTYPLGAEQKQLLGRILSEKFGRGINLETAVDKELAAGLIIEYGGRVIDASLKNKLDKALPYIKEAIKGKILGGQ